MRCPAHRTWILLLLLAACAPAGGRPATEAVRVATRTPVELPSLTAAAPVSVTPSLTPPLIPPSPVPVEPSPTVLPSDTPLELPTLSLPTTAPTDMPQPTVGSGAIQFYNPGPLSKLVSEITLYGYAIPGYNYVGRAELFGEDGRLISQKILQLNTAYTWAFFYSKLPFETSGVGELARLSLSTFDRYGRPKALGAVHLLLLAEGTTIINPPGNLKERCLLETPGSTQHPSGGSLTVAGKMRPYNGLPLVVELIDREGQILGAGLAPVTPALDDSYVPFQVTIPYSVSTGTWVLVVVRQSDERIPGVMYLYSKEFYLYP